MKNEIILMMNMMMVGLDPGPLVRGLFRFALVNTLVALENPLVVFVVLALELFF